MATTVTIQQNNPTVTITKTGQVNVALQVPGPQGPASMVVVNHGSTGTTARPVGPAVVYWVGTARPVNAQPYDMWMNA